MSVAASRFFAQEANEALSSDFKDAVSRLEASVAGGIHNKESLLDWYIQSIRPENVPSLSTRSAQLKPLSSGPSGASGNFERFEDQLVRSLIEAIARLSCLGQIDLNSVASCKLVVTP